MTEEEAAELAQLERRATKLFSGRVEFLLSAPQLKFLPEPTVPEIAFAGRSNVGKSSLLNALTGRKAIARASVTPGRTQELNFFEVGEPTLFRLVDSRHGLKDVDRDMMKMLDEAAVGYRIVLTKADKVKASDLEKVVAETEAEARKHIAAYPQIHVTSSEKGMGIAELRAAVLSDVGV